jgi:hypothetical protein
LIPVFYRKKVGFQRKSKFVDKLKSNFAIQFFFKPQGFSNIALDKLNFMLDQLFKIVKQFGKESVVDNPEVPNENNEEVMAEATRTISSGFQNIVAGGGFENIVDLFKGGGNTSSANNASAGVGSMLKNPIVSMMVGYFISKLVSKYKMSPSSASNVASTLIPNTLNSLISQTKDPNNPDITMDKIISSLTGGSEETQQNGGGMLQNLLDRFTGGGNSGNGGNGGGVDIQSIIGNLTKKAQNSFQDKGQSGGGGLMDIIKGFMSK